VRFENEGTIAPYFSFTKEKHMTDIEQAKARAEAVFKRKEEKARQGAEAWTEYEEQRRAELEKTERLRALRLAKEAAESRPRVNGNR
jgi:hypothetical protein